MKCVDTFGEPHLPTPHSGFVRMSTALLTPVRNHSQSSHLDVEFVDGIFLDGDVLVVAAVVRTDEELVVRITVLLQ